MTTFLKTLVVAASLLAGVSATSTAFAKPGFSSDSCVGSSLNQHGVWDCR